MSIQEINHHRSQGWQVRVFRDKEVITRFFAFKKHGGKEAAHEQAKTCEAQLNTILGPETKCQRRGCHVAKPNANSRSGVAGIQAVLLNNNKRHDELNFIVVWSETIDGERRQGRKQISAKRHSILGALERLLSIRENKTGHAQLTAPDAWQIIRKNLVKRYGSRRVANAEFNCPTISLA